MSQICMDSSRYYRLTFFLLVSVIFHLLVYFVADATSILSMNPVKVSKHKDADVRSKDYKEHSSDINELKAIPDSGRNYGEMPSLNSVKGNSLAGKVLKFKEVVRYVKIGTAQNVSLKEATEMYNLYMFLLEWLEKALDKLALFLVKFNI